MKKVHLINSDITQFPVDAIVNSANKSLLGGGGLDYIIQKKAGSLMKAACIQINKEKGGCPTGQAEVTVGGNLPAKYVIHAVAPRWFDGSHNEEQLLCDVYWNAMNRANEIEAKIVSFPNLGTGIYNFPKQKAAEIAIGTVLPTLVKCTNVFEVLFFCHDIENYNIYKNILSDLDDPRLDINIHVNFNGKLYENS